MNNTTKAVFITAAIVLIVALLISNPLGLLAIVGGMVALALILVAAEAVAIKMSDRNEQR